MLTDGTVMMHEYATPNWWRLTPDNSGSYAKGTWSQLGSMASNYAPTAFASAVLADGRVIVAGGEFNFGQGQYLDVVALYDPTTDTWTAVNPPAGWQKIGDAPSVVLADGTFMLGQTLSNLMALFNAQTLTWTPTGIGKLYSSTEAGWTLLPDGSVLEVPVYPPNTEKYLPSSGTWVSAGNIPVDLIKYIEVGPQVLRPDGTVLVTGATGNSAIYYSGDLSPWGDKWFTGPSFPNGDDMADAPAALLPNGNVLCDTSLGDGFSPPVSFYEFDGKKFDLVPSPPNPGTASEYGRMLELPTGEILFAVADDMTIDVELYTTGKESVLYSFTGGADGGFPGYGVLLRDGAGNFYGTTVEGGAFGEGTVFKLNSAGQETVLHSFTGGADGGHPMAGLLADANGSSVYGTTWMGGALGSGTVYKLSKSGKGAILYTFTGGADGGGPAAGLIQDTEGNLYGTTGGGGASGFGTVFELSRTGQESVLYSFLLESDGGIPCAGLITDSAGNLYGTTPNGGGGLNFYNFGTVFKLGR